MVSKTEYQLTQEQAKKAIEMCLENAESYLNDADMYISNNKTDHLAIPIVFAIPEFELIVFLILGLSFTIVIVFSQLKIKRKLLLFSNQ